MKKTTDYTTILTKSEHLIALAEAEGHYRGKKLRAWKNAYEKAREKHCVEVAIAIAESAVGPGVAEVVAEAAEALSVRAEDDPSIELPRHPLAGIVPPLDLRVSKRDKRQITTRVGAMKRARKKS